MNERIKRFKAMPLVVLFKSESDGPDKFVNILEENNFNVRSINCLSFQFKNLSLLYDQLKDCDSYEGIIFISPRAVQAVYESVEKHSEVISLWKNKTNYSVGESTSGLAKRLLNIDTQGQQSGNAQNLSSLIISNHQRNQTKSFLFPSGNLRQETLEKSLTENAIDVKCLEVYETIQHPNLEKSIEELKTAKAEFVVYFSPSGVKFSLPLIKKHQVRLQDLKVIAIGPSTKKCLEENDLQCYRMCSKPSPESLLEALSRES